MEKTVVTINKGNYLEVYLDNKYVCDVPISKPKAWHDGMNKTDLSALTKAELIESIIKGELINGEK